MKTLITLLQGAIMGVAEIIPGVSGSTFALAMGIYDDFINLLHDISSLVKAIVLYLLRKTPRIDIVESFEAINLRFGTMLFLGMAISIIALSHIVDLALTEYRQYVFAFFFGLIIASIVIPISEMKERRFRHVGMFVLVAVLTFFILGLRPYETDTPSTLLLFFGGVIGVSGLLLPGISGSFILLMIGLYEYIIASVKAITSFDATGTQIFNLVIFAAGLLIGFVGFVRVIKFGFKRYPNALLAVIAGVMLGSLHVIYPFFTNDDSVKTWYFPWDQVEAYDSVIALLLIIVGIGVIALLSLIRRKFDDAIEIVTSVSE